MAHLEIAEKQLPEFASSSNDAETQEEASAQQESEEPSQGSINEMENLPKEEPDCPYATKGLHVTFHPEPEHVQGKKYQQRRLQSLEGMGQEDNFHRQQRSRLPLPDFFKFDGPQYSSFDEILTLVGTMGGFQIMWIMKLLLPIAVFNGWLMLDTDFLFMTPNHWCAPLDEMEIQTTPNITAWKMINLPHSLDSKGHANFSQCKMYTDYATERSCPAGWTYDNTTYHSSLVIANNWVCERKVGKELAYVLISAGLIVGTLAFGLLADKLRRRLTYFLVAVLSFLAYGLISFFSKEVGILYFALFVKTATSTTLLQLPLLWIMEITDGKHRPLVYGIVGLGNLIGVGLLTLIVHTFPDFITIGISGACFSLVIIVMVFFMDESPRWLLSRNKFVEAAECLYHMAWYNGVLFDDSEFSRTYLFDATRFLNIFKRSKASSTYSKYHFIEIFCKPHSLRIAIRLLFMWFAMGVIDVTLLNNTPAASENIFLTAFLLRLPHLPGLIVGVVMPYLAGYRDSQIICHGVFTILLFVTGLVHSYSVAPRILGSILRMIFSAIFSLLFIHTGELISTTVRASFMGACWFAYYFLSMVIPHIDFMHRNWYGIAYFVCSFLSLMCAVAVAFLPETMGEPMPDFLDDTEDKRSDRFGVYLQKNWILKPASVVSAERGNFNVAFELQEQESNVTTITSTNVLPDDAAPDENPEEFQERMI